MPRGIYKRTKPVWNKGGTARDNPIIAQIAEKQRGRTYSQETKEKMRKAKEGYIPWNKGETKETNQSMAAISEKLTGRERSPEHCKAISEAKKGGIPWNKGEDLPKGIFHHSEATKELLREKNLGENNPMFGKKQSEEHIKKRIEFLIGIPRPEEVIEKIRQGNLGKEVSEETKQRISESMKGNVPWNVGIPMSEEQKQIYRDLFTGVPQSLETRQKKSIAHIEKNKKLGFKHEGGYEGFGRFYKDRVRQRDGYKCIECGRSQEEDMKQYGVKLSVHHIDYLKRNSFFRNNISLCKCCHGSTNHNNLDEWSRYYYKKLKSIYGYDYSLDHAENNILKQSDNIKKILEEIENEARKEQVEKDSNIAIQPERV